jgi:outer membrane protein, protease secretion system
LQAMREYHPALQVRRLAVQTAEATQMRARAGHHPQLDLVASSSNNTNESLSALNQSAQQRSVGLQLNVPLYQGGQVGHAVRQAIAETNRAAAELDAEELNQAREATRLHAAATAAQHRTNAHGQAVRAAHIAVLAAQRGMQTGLTTRSELIAAQRRLVQAETEMTQSQADHWLARYRLALRTFADPVSAIAELDRLERASPP